VDLSLKRVNDHQKREKITEWKNDQKSEKLLELVAAQLKKSVDECEKEFASDLRSRYATLYDAFEDAAVSEEWLPEVKAKWKTTFIKIAKENIVPPEVEIGGYLETYSIASNGIESIKKTLTSVNSQNVNIQYSGAPKYRIFVTDKDYKSAEDTLKKSVQKILDTAKKNNVSAKFIRE
jgi:translation initiation factor 2 subunit 1